VRERIRKPFAEHVERRIAAARPSHVKYVHPVRQEVATGLVAAVYAQVATDFKVLPPLTLFSPAPKLLAGAWSLVRETLLVGPVARLPKEVVATAVSRVNACTYCVDAHTMMLGGAGARPAADALRGAQPEQIDDSTMRSLAIWAWRTRSMADQTPEAPPFDRASAPQMIGTAIAFHFINRLVNVFLGPSPVQLPPGLRWAKGLLGRIAEHTFARRLLTLSPVPGLSLDLLPEVAVPEEFHWACGNPFVAGAFGRLAVAIDEVGCRVIPAQVRELVNARLCRWQGESMGLSRNWVEAEIRPLEESVKPVGRLALLTALASYQVDATVVEGSRARLYDDDEALLGTVSWAAFAAVRRIASWLTAKNTLESDPLVSAPATLSQRQVSGLHGTHSSARLILQQPD
jgi:AhpD family alkylhydroperoxidase